MVFVAPVAAVTYYEREPYTAIESYTEKEPFTRTVPIDYRVTEATWYNWFWNPGADIWVIIKNADVKSGSFHVTFELTTTGGARITRSATEYIAIGKERKVLVKHPGDRLRTFSYSISPPMKDVTEYRDVRKTRQITRYRDVARTKRVSLFEYLTDWR